MLKHLEFIVVCLIVLAFIHQWSSAETCPANVAIVFVWKIESQVPPKSWLMMMMLRFRMAKHHIRFSIRYSSTFQIFSIVCPWVSYDCFQSFPYNSHGFPWFPHGFSMVSPWSQFAGFPPARFLFRWAPKPGAHGECQAWRPGSGFLRYQMYISGIGKCPILGLLDITQNSSHQKDHIPNGI